MFDRFHESVKLLAHVPADSASTAVTSSWVSMAGFTEIVAVISLGDIQASGTFNAKLREATDSSGTSPQDITGKSVTQLTQAGGDSDDALIISVLADEMDVDDSYTHVACVVTPAVAAAEFSVMIFGVRPRHKPVATTAWTEVVT